MKNRGFLVTALAMGFSFLAANTVGLAASDSAKSAAVYLISPGDGDVIEGPVTVRFGLSGMGVAPAGVERANTGHHHLVIDAALPETNKPIPASAQYRHFGGGQTEAVVELGPGRHTLQLLLGDHGHVPHDPPLISQKITITVK